MVYMPHNLILRNAMLNASFVEVLQMLKQWKLLLQVLKIVPTRTARRRASDPVQSSESAFTFRTLSPSFRLELAHWVVESSPLCWGNIAHYCTANVSDYLLINQVVITKALPFPVPSSLEC